MFSESRGGVIRGDDANACVVGEFSLLLDILPLLKKLPSAVLIGDIVRSGDNVIRWAIDFTGDVGESKLNDFARVSAIRRRACSRKRACRSSCNKKYNNIGLASVRPC